MYFLGAQQGTPDCNDNKGWINSWDNDVQIDGAYAPTADQSITSGYCGWAAGSAHTGGFSLAMADGSVHFVAYNVTLPVREAMCQMNDGTVVNLPF